MSDNIKGTIGVAFAWIATYLTLDRIAVILAIIYTILQISAFVYPWHKKLWKKLGANE